MVQKMFVQHTLAITKYGDIYTTQHYRFSTLLHVGHEPSGSKLYFLYKLLTSYLIFHCRYKRSQTIPCSTGYRARCTTQNNHAILPIALVTYVVIKALFLASTPAVSHNFVKTIRSDSEVPINESLDSLQSHKLDGKVCLLYNPWFLQVQLVRTSLIGPPLTVFKFMALLVKWPLYGGNLH